MNIQDLIEDLLVELSYQSPNGVPDLKNRETIRFIYEYFSERGLSEVGQELINNLLVEEDEKTFKNPKLNQVVQYKDKDGKDKEGLIGNLLRLKTDQPGREAAERALSGLSDEERDQLNKDLGGEGGGGEQPDQQSGEGQVQQQTQQGTALNPDTEAGKDFTDQLSPTDPAFTGEKEEDKPDEVKQTKAETEGYESITDERILNAVTKFKEFLSEEQKKAIELSKRARVKRLQQIDELRESFNKLPGPIRNKASVVFAKGLVFEGRENSGIGKNRLGYLDVKGLVENKQYLLEAYGDGSSETVKKFVRNSRKIQVSEDYVRSSFDLLPKELQSSLSGKGKVGDAGKNKHFLGYLREDETITSDKNDPTIKKDEQGKLVVKRGNPPSKDRGLFVWRCILEQGGQDPYTGLPLDLSSIDLEHTVAFDNKDNGNPTEQDYLDREHDDNIIICATNINQKKSNLSMREFIERHVDTQAEKTEEQFKAISQAYEEVNKVATQSEQTAGLLLEEGKLKQGYDYNTLKETFDLDIIKYQNAKEEFKKVAESKKDKEKISTLKSELGKDTIMAMGLSRGLTDKSGRRTVKLSSDNLYKGFILSMADNFDRQEEFKQAWEDARAVGNSDEYRLKGKGQQAMIRYLVNNGYISQRVLSDSKLGRVFNNALNEIYVDEFEAYILVE